nr:plasmid mobilization relaxosome protein MobC [Hyphomicrobium nitrativorans]
MTLSAEASTRGITVSALARLILTAHLKAQRAELPRRRGTDAALLRQFIRIGNNLNQLTRQANAGLVAVSADELHTCLDRINTLARAL